MKQNKDKFQNLINKIAAKRFSEKEKIILLVCFFVLAACVLYYIHVWTNSFKNDVAIIEPIMPKLNSKSKVNVTEKIKLSIKETAALFKKPDFRDPFLASKNSNIVPVENKKQLITLKLKGILWDKLVPSAIINSKIVKIGDLIFRKTVVDIEKDKVILMENGEIQILYLKKK